MTSDLKYTEKKTDGLPLPKRYWAILSIALGLFPLELAICYQYTYRYTALYMVYKYLPDHSSRFDIIWRIILCGVGFRLFQLPNNSTIISSAPQHRSGAASGMLGTARLLGQTLGATLAAMMFTLVPGNSTQAALLLAGTFALVAAVVSCLRLSQTSPLKQNS